MKREIMTARRQGRVGAVTVAIFTIAMMFVTIFFASASEAQAQESVTQVTTYVVKTQEERRSTRWTLTEWLRIKERMKMMDVWLAMFSSPKDKEFKPELSLSYQKTRGQLGLGKVVGAEGQNVDGYAVETQFWLTNIVSSTTGLRTLNLDFGLEFSQKDLGELAFAEPSLSGDVALAALGDGVSRTGRNQTASANLRLFGDSVQDSSLVFKYGGFRHTNSVPSWAVDGQNDSKDNVHSGRMIGAELALYFWSFLGVEGAYHAFGDPAESSATFGSYYEYMAFIEVSLLRIMVGRYQEDWHLVRDAQEQDTSEAGLLAGLKLQL